MCTSGFGNSVQCLGSSYSGIPVAACSEFTLPRCALCELGPEIVAGQRPSKILMSLCILQASRCPSTRSRHGELPLSTNGCCKALASRFSIHSLLLQQAKLPMTHAKVLFLPCRFIGG